ncbi:MAG: ATP-binding protein [Gemmatimonadales bacterium]
MKIRPIYGHDALLHRLAGALASSRFPQAALFSGAAGVGKQRLALWVAQGLLCERGPGAPCDECIACLQVLGLSHPDLHWFVPIPRPKAADRSKRVEEAKDLLAEVMADRRQSPLYCRPDGMASHALASIQLLRRVVGVTPFSAQKKVVILGDAERLVVQEASQEAANALLKILEEPPADTVIILTASESQALLPTIRSRLVPLRVGRVADDVVERFLSQELRPAPRGAALHRRVLLAEGSIGQALWMEDGSTNVTERARRFLDSVDGGPADWTPIALAQAPWGARGQFTGFLDSASLELRERLQERSNSGGNVQGVLRALERVQETRAEAQGNVNPQLALAVLAGDLERLL